MKKQLAFVMAPALAVALGSAASAGPPVELWDNGPLITTPGGGFGGADVSELQTLIGGNILGYGHQVSAGNRIADDFVVGVGGWHIDTVIFYAYQTGGGIPSTITSVNLNIWDGRPGDGGENLVGTGTMTGTEWSGIYRATEEAPLGSARAIMAQIITVNIDLAPGTYWFDWQTDGSAAFSGPWAPPVTFVGMGGSGNARQFTAKGWGDAFDDAAGWHDDFPFIINGTVIPGPAGLMLFAVGGLVASRRRRR